jgi:hypothetical protein
VADSLTAAWSYRMMKVTAKAHSVSLLVGLTLTMPVLKATLVKRFRTKRAL